MSLTNPSRILRRLAGRVRMAASEIQEKTTIGKLLLIATELEEEAAALEEKARR